MINEINQIVLAIKQNNLALLNSKYIHPINGYFDITKFQNNNIFEIKKSISEVDNNIDFFDIKAIDYIERLDVYMEDLERGEYNPIFESKNKFNSFNKVPKKMVYNNSRNQRVRYNRKILN